MDRLAVKKIYLSTLPAQTAQLNEGSGKFYCYQTSADEALELIDDLDSYENKEHTCTIFVTERARVTYRLSLKKEIKTAIHKTLVFKLTGQEASVDAQIRILGTTSDKITLKTVQEHLAPRAYSECTIKAVLDQEAVLSCTSFIIVAQEAQHTTARQVNKNILLGSKARVISVPQLEIEAHEVSCKHGAAVSQLGEEQFFYLQSRGLSGQDARQLLINAFLDEAA